jgi:hypothetical protein
MQRAITDFHTDEHGGWVTELESGHDQHVRHQPTFILQPRVVTVEDRRVKLDARLECVLCEHV